MYCLYVSYLCHFYLYYYVLYITKFWRLIDVNLRQLLRCLNVTITTLFCLYHYVTCTWRAGRRKRLCSKWSCDRYSYFYFLHLYIYMVVYPALFVGYRARWMWQRQQTPAPEHVTYLASCSTLTSCMRLQCLGWMTATPRYGTSTLFTVHFFNECKENGTVLQKQNLVKELNIKQKLEFIPMHKGENIK